MSRQPDQKTKNSVCINSYNFKLSNNDDDKDDEIEENCEIIQDNDIDDDDDEIIEMKCETEAIKKSKIN